MLLVERDSTLPQQQISAFLVEIQWLRRSGIPECFLFPTARAPMMTGQQLIEHIQLGRQCCKNECRVFKNGFIWPSNSEEAAYTGSFVIVTVQENERQDQCSNQREPRERSRSRTRENEGTVVQLCQVACFSPRQSSPGQRQTIVHLALDTTIALLRRALRLNWQTLGEDSTWSPVEVHPAHRDSVILQQFERVFVLWDYERCPAALDKKVVLIEATFAGTPMTSVSDSNAFTVSGRMYGFELLFATQLHALCTGPVNYRCELWHNQNRIDADQQVSVRHGDFCRIIVFRSDQIASYAIVYSASISRRELSHSDFTFSPPHLREAWQNLIANIEGPLPWEEATEGLRPPGNGKDVTIVNCGYNLHGLDDTVEVAGIHYVFDWCPPRVTLLLSESLHGSRNVSHCRARPRTACTCTEL